MINSVQQDYNVKMQNKNSLAIFLFWLFISGTFIIFALESEMHVYKLGYTQQAHNVESTSFHRCIPVW